MADNSKVKYVDTNAALVKMTSGVPFLTGNPMSDSSDSEIENDDFDISRRGLQSESLDYRNINIAQNKNTVNKKENTFNQDHHQQTLKRQSEYAHHSSVKPASAAPVASQVQGSFFHQDISNDARSSLRKSYTNKDDNKNETGSQVKYRQMVSQKTDVDKNIHDDLTTDTSRSISSSRSLNDIKNMQKDVDSYKGIPEADDTVRTAPSSSRKHKQSSEHLTVKSLKEHEQTARLSQSLENSQESVMKQWQSGLVVSSSMNAISKPRHRHKVKTARVNPFNNELLIDEDHFSDTYENYFRSSRNSPGSTRSSSQGPDWQHDPSDVSFAELGLSEDHFSHPQSYFGLSGAEELELAIENCKELIRDAAPGSDKQKNLVLKLVQLKIKLQEVKEGPEPVPDNVKVILSHKMMLMSSRTSKYYCERCNAAIWGMLQVWYKCTECGYRCHEKCLQQILRTCAKAKVIENPTLITDICPKESNGLAGQSYRCWECRLAISYKSGHSEPRLCDYTGHYYCEFCHWNNTFVVPARVLHNWDFTPHKVCRAAKQFLRLMQKKAVIRIQDINPMLFVYVDQLNEVKKLREEMMIMKKYILSCTVAMSAKLLLQLENRQHFVESSDRYSMQDLVDAEDILLPELVSVHSTWAQHIKVDCQLCQGRGFCCELCGEKEILFPFDSTAVVCAKCSNVLHRHCFAKSSVCPRCERRDKRKCNDNDGLAKS